MPNHSSTTKQNKLSAYILIIVFVGPLIVAYVLFALRNTLHFKTIQTGTLISPPVASATLSFFDPKYLGKWQIVYLSPAVCDMDCQTFKTSLEKIHFALGKERHRVKNRSFSGTSTTPFKTGDILMIDPQGWLIMQYPPSADLKGLLRDVRQLLRLSHAG